MAQNSVYMTTTEVADDLRSAIARSRVKALREIRITFKNKDSRRRHLAERELRNLREQLNRIIILLEGRK